MRHDFRPAYLTSAKRSKDTEINPIKFHLYYHLLELQKSVLKTLADLEVEHENLVPSRTELNFKVFKTMEIIK